MRLNARLARLEATHKKILRCLWCLYNLRSVGKSQRQHYKSTPADFMAVKCWSCGTRYNVPLTGLQAHEREVMRLIHKSHPTKAFNNERVYTAHLWREFSDPQVEKYWAEKNRRRENNKSRKSGVSPAQRDYRPQQNMTAAQRKAQRERELLRNEVREFRQKEYERWACLARGPESFPIDKTLEEIGERYRMENWGHNMDEVVLQADLPVEGYSKVVNDYKVSVVICYQHLSKLKKREACELVLWGKPQPDTLDEIAFFEARLEKLPAIARRAFRLEELEKRRKEEERRRQNEEYMARNRMSVRS